MYPVVALVGRPNVGKSTLFNALTGTRLALVADEPGLTRDRQYALARLGGREVNLVDTGGMIDQAIELEGRMAAQTDAAIAEADVAVVVVDARAGLTPADEAVVERLRHAGRPFQLVVNKTDGVHAEVAMADFHGLGSDPVGISAFRRRGLKRLGEVVAGLLPEAPVPVAGDEVAGGIRVAVVGRPNVGKSTLINRLLGEERLLAWDQPGTTRDAVAVAFERDGRHFTLVDTAGLRRRARVQGTIEKFSAVKTLDAIREAHVVVLVLDAREGLSEQDQHLVGHVIEAGRGLVLAINKWDGLDADHKRRVRAEHERRFAFVDFAETRFISALHGTGVGRLLNAVARAHAAGQKSLGTAEITRVLEDAVFAHPPPIAGGGRVRLRYAHQGGTNPPTFVVHGSRVARLPSSYKRYLAGRFRQAFDLRGTPLRLEFRAGENPYVKSAARSRAGGRGRGAAGKRPRSAPGKGVRSRR